MKKILASILFFTALGGRAQMLDTIVVHYYDNFPYSYMEEGKLKGIEIDIFNEYVLWLKAKKNIQTVVSYIPYKEFSTFYKSVKEGRTNVVGLGSVTRSSAREQEIAFAPPFLQNVAVLISAGSVSTVKEKNNDEVNRAFKGLNGVAVGRSSHLAYLNQIKSQFLPEMKITTLETQNQVIENIISVPSNIGYVDLVAYWAFLRRSPSKFIKIQKAFTEPREDLAFCLPLQNKQSLLLSEFFESGFGFTATRAYHQILEKYLGYEVLESVEIR